MYLFLVHGYPSLMVVQEDAFQKTVIFFVTFTDYSSNGRHFSLGSSPPTFDQETVSCPTVQTLVENNKTPLMGGNASN